MPVTEAVHQAQIDELEERVSTLFESFPDSDTDDDEKEVRQRSRTVGATARRSRSRPQQGTDDASYVSHTLFSTSVPDNAAGAVDSSSSKQRSHQLVTSPSASSRKKPCYLPEKQREPGFIHISTPELVLKLAETEHNLVDAAECMMCRKAEAEMSLLREKIAMLLQESTSRKILINQLEEALVKQQAQLGAASGSEREMLLSSQLAQATARATKAEGELLETTDKHAADSKDVEERNLGLVGEVERLEELDTQAVIKDLRSKNSSARSTQLESNKALRLAHFSAMEMRSEMARLASTTGTAREAALAEQLEKALAQADLAMSRNSHMEKARLNENADIQNLVPDLTPRTKSLAQAKENRFKASMNILKPLGMKIMYGAIGGAFATWQVNWLDAEDEEAALTAPLAGSYGGETAAMLGKKVIKFQNEAVKNGLKAASVEKRLEETTAALEETQALLQDEIKARIEQLKKLEMLDAIPEDTLNSSVEGRETLLISQLADATEKREAAEKRLGMVRSKSMSIQKDLTVEAMQLRDFLDKSQAKVNHLEAKAEDMASLVDEKEQAVEENEDLRLSNGRLKKIIGELNAHATGFELRSLQQRSQLADASLRGVQISGLRKEDQMLKLAANETIKALNETVDDLVSESTNPATEVERMEAALERQKEVTMALREKSGDEHQDRGKHERELAKFMADASKMALLYKQAEQQITALTEEVAELKSNAQSTAEESINRATHSLEQEAVSVESESVKLAAKLSQTEAALEAAIEKETEAVEDLKETTEIYESAIQLGDAEKQLFATLKTCKEKLKSAQMDSLSLGEQLQEAKQELEHRAALLQAFGEQKERGGTISAT